MQNITNDHILALFPIPVVKMPIGINIDLSKQVLACKSLELIDTKADPSYTHGRSKDAYVLDKNLFAELKLLLEARISEYMRVVLSLEYPAQLTQSWVNLNKPGQGTHIHSHSNSIVSAVYYLDCPTGAKIRFHKAPKSYGYVWAMEPYVNTESANKNFLAYDWIDVPVETGDLVMFPSYLQHSVPPNESEDDRWSLAMNSMPLMALGHYNALTEMVLGPTNGPGYPD